MEPTNRTTTTSRPRPIPAQGGSGKPSPQPAGRSGTFEDDVDRRRFVTVLRGYDRIEVDEYIDDLLAVVATLRSSAADADKSRRSAEERAAAAERRAAESASAPQPAAAPTEGFGMRAERLLRLAENEAAEIRAAAAAESSAVVERSRADAEQRRHEAEQALITRSAQADQENARRTAAGQQPIKIINYAYLLPQRKLVPPFLDVLARVLVALANKPLASPVQLWPHQVPQLAWPPGQV